MLTYYAVALAASAVGLLIVRQRARSFLACFFSIGNRAQSIIVSFGAERCTVLAVILLGSLFFLEMWEIDSFRRLSPLEPRVHYDLIMFGLDVLATLDLYILYWSLSASAFPRMVRAALLAIPMFMYGYAVVTTTLPTPDLYAYIAYAKLGPNAYVPPNAPFTGEFAMLNGQISRAWKILEPAPYGPFFLALDWLVASRAHSVMAAIVALRLLNLAAMGACFFALRVLGFRAPLLAVAFIDPEIVIHYVADGHNDILSVAAILWAMALRERSVVAATLLAIVSGTIKASYTIVALLIVYGEQRRGRQIAIAGTILVGTLVVSALAGGRAYLHGLTWHASANTLTVPVWQQAMHAGAILAAVVAIAAAIFYKRTLFEAAYTLPAFTAAMYSWYLVLGIPYAVLNRRYAVAFFTIFPIASYLANGLATQFFTYRTALALAIAFLIWTLGFERRAPGAVAGPGKHDAADYQ